MMNAWIDRKYYQHNLQLTKRFKTTKPYSHLILKNFFNPQKLEALRTALFTEPFERIDKDLFSFENTKDLATSRNPVISEFYQFFSSQEFRKCMEQITGEKLGTISDMHAHKFLQGDYLLFHDDVVERRKLAYVINLSHGFTRQDGGRFMMYDVKKPQKSVISLIPQFNTFVCFKVSNKSLHTVEEVLTNKERLTIGGWFL